MKIIAKLIVVLTTVITMNLHVAIAAEPQKKSKSSFRRPASETWGLWRVTGYDERKLRAYAVALPDNWRQQAMKSDGWLPVGQIVKIEHDPAGGVIYGSAGIENGTGGDTLSWQFMPPISPEMCGQGEWGVDCKNLNRPSIPGRMVVEPELTRTRYKGRDGNANAKLWVDLAPRFYELTDEGKYSNSLKVFSVGQNKLLLSVIYKLPVKLSNGNEKIEVMTVLERLQ